MHNLIKGISLSSMVLVATSYAGESVDQRLSADGVNKVIIENPQGLVKIVGSTQREVSVVGELDDQAKKFTFEKEGSSIVIKVEMPRNSTSWSSKDYDGSKLTITMPSEIRVSFNGISSDVEINGIEHGSEIKTISGKIKAQQLSNHVELTSVSGDISSKQLSGKVSLTVVSGDIKDKNSSGRIDLRAVSGSIDSESTASELSVESVSGDIRLSLERVDELQIQSVSGDSDVKLNLSDHGMVKFSSVSGDIDIAFQPEIQASFRVKTNAGGDIINKITNDKVKQAKYGPSEKLSFTTGNGAATFKATTLSGSITLATH